MVHWQTAMCYVASVHCMKQAADDRLTEQLSPEVACNAP